MLEEIKYIVGNALGLSQSRVQAFTENTKLLGSIPELDSMAVVTILTAIEEHYGFVVDDDEISADIFLSLGTLCEYIEKKLGNTPDI